MTVDLVSDSVEKLLADECTPQRVRSVDDGRSVGGLWTAIAESGFADALVPEARGGAGLGLADAFAIAFACGRHALPVPLAPTMMVRALLASAGEAWPEGPATFAEATAGSQGPAVTCHRVPYGRTAEWVLVGAPGRGLLLSARAADVSPTGVRGSLEATLRWSSVPEETVRVGELPLKTIGACVYAAQLAGAMERVLEGTIAHANDRVQFGRSIGKFQAIQQQLSVAAEQVFASRMAARLGCSGASHIPGELQAAVAKARTSEAAVMVAGIAHAVQGAMGIAEESELHLYTRCLHEWRLAYGSERYWNERIGEAVLADASGDFVATLRQRLSPIHLTIAKEDR